MKASKSEQAKLFWSYGRKYWNVTEVVCKGIAKNKNRSMVFSDLPSNAKAFRRQMLWNDYSMIVPLLFMFYHGMELMLKGFAVLHVKGIPKTNHEISELFKAFKENYPAETRLHCLFGKYIDDRYAMPEILKSFFDNNHMNVNRFYESLRYPFSRSMETFETHSLKYQGSTGVPFFRQLQKDIAEICKNIIRLGLL